MITYRAGVECPGVRGLTPAHTGGRFRTDPRTSTGVAIRCVECRRKDLARLDTKRAVTKAWVAARKIGGRVEVVGGRPVVLPPRFTASAVGAVPPTVAPPVAPVAASNPAPVEPEPVEFTPAPDVPLRRREDRGEGGRYFWEKPEDRAMTDLWIRMNLEDGERLPLLAVGPSGTGKTEGMKNAAERAGIPFYKIDCPAMTTDDKWLGHKEIDSQGTHFVLSQHLKWLGAIDCEPGMVVYDEISRLHANRLNLILPVLDDSQALFVPEINDYIRVHPKTLVAATANIGLGYPGTFGMDIALHDRFAFLLERNFPPTDAEVRVLTERTGISPVQARILVEIASLIRAKAKNGELPKPVSTRALIATARLVKKGMDISNACEYTWVKKYADDGEERTVVRTAIRGKVPA